MTEIVCPRKVLLVFYSKKKASISKYITYECILIALKLKAISPSPIQIIIKKILNGWPLYSLPITYTHIIFIKIERKKKKFIVKMYMSYDIHIDILDV